MADGCTKRTSSGTTTRQGAPPRATARGSPDCPKNVELAGWAGQAICRRSLECRDATLSPAVTSAARRLSVEQRRRERRSRCPCRSSTDRRRRSAEEPALLRSAGGSMPDGGSAGLPAGACAPGREHGDRAHGRDLRVRSSGSRAGGLRCPAGRGAGLVDRRVWSAGIARAAGLCPRPRGRAGRSTRDLSPPQVRRSREWACAGARPARREGRRRMLRTTCATPRPAPRCIPGATAPTS